MVASHKTRCSNANVMRIAFFALLMTFFFILAPADAFAKYSGGTGERDDPYLIADVNDLHNLALNTNDYAKHFLLLNDIDLDPNLPGRRTYTTALIAPDADNTKSGFQGTRFYGTFDGARHVINNLVIDASGTGNGYLGLFGVTDSSSCITNLQIENASVIATTGSSYIGGLCAENSKATITNCSFTGTVTGGSSSRMLAAICGNNDRGSINNCCATVSVSGRSSIGGICGRNMGNISNCYTAGSVTGRNDTGGLCGDNSLGTISDCYSVATVTGHDTTGSLCGSSYNARISNCFFLDTSGPDNGLGTPLTDSEMKQQSSFVGWDFADEAACGTSQTWNIEPGAYPMLRYFEAGFAPHSFFGDGTQQSPYLIYDASDLGAVWQQPHANYRLQNDIDLAGISFSVAVVPAFCGMLDGNNNTIAGLDISGGGYLGLIGFMQTNAVVINLAVESAAINAGYNAQYVGFLAGYNNGLICNSFATGNVVAGDQSNHLGGLCGENDEGIIINCYAAAIIAGHNSLGGLCGNNGNGLIYNCYSTGSITGTDNSNCLGGVCGINRIGAITNCFSTATVTAADNSHELAGICGRNLSGCISNCFASGSISGPGNSYQLGGICGTNGGGVLNCFFLATAAPSNGIGNPLNETQMKQRSSFTEWDFVDAIWDGTAQTWRIEPDSFPTLNYFHPDFIPYAFAGNGTQQNPYLIYDANDLGAIWQKPARHYRLANDINLSGITFSVAAIPVLRGTFDGGRNTISDLRISGAGYLGLFGFLKANAAVTALTIENANVTAADNTRSVGILCGYNDYAAVSNCSSTGTVTGDNLVGGIVGFNYSGSINRSFSHARIISTAGSSLGSLCGSNYHGIIANSFSTGSVNGGASSEYLGGFCGYNHDGIIVNSYSTGAVSDANNPSFLGGFCGRNSSGRLENCYFLDIAGPDNSVATPLTDGQMKQQDSFISWDFFGETANGTEDIWFMPDANYPILAWQLPPAPIEANVSIFPRVINRHAKGPKNIGALIRLTEGITGDQIDPNSALTLYPLAIPSQKLYIISCHSGRYKGINIFGFFNRAELLDAISEDGKLDIEISGQLTTGQYFSGFDTLWIEGKPNTPKSGKPPKTWCRPGK